MGGKLTTAVLGATGYSGYELTRLLLRHEQLQKPLLLKREGGRGKDLIESFPALWGNGGYPLEPFSLETLKCAGVDLLFLATPHQLSRTLVPEVVSAGIRVIDLSGAWRLRRPEHQSVYGFDDADVKAAHEAMSRAVYGLPELRMEEIADAVLVANPGCYATSVILALAPLVAAGFI